VKEFSRDEHRDLPAGVDTMVRVMVAQRRKLTEGDKMAGRHGNKGVISKVLPAEDMPFMADGTPIATMMAVSPLTSPTRSASRHAASTMPTVTSSRSRDTATLSAAAFRRYWPARILSTTPTVNCLHATTLRMGRATAGTICTYTERFLA